MNRKKSTKSDNSDIILPTDRIGLLDYLWAVQNAHGYIRSEDISACAKALKISQIDVEGVVSFYHFFHRKPAGEFTIYLNKSPVCECKGFERVKEAFEAATGGKFNGVDPSGEWGLFETACIGLSDMEPAALIEFYPFTNLNSLKVRDIVAKLKQGANPADICDPVPDHIRSVPDSDKAILLRDYNPGIALEALKDHTPESVLEAIKKSGLRGMGGAFFPTGFKWEACRKDPESPKYIFCNADEGEPGTFKDRVLMNSLPGLMLEGMAIAGYAVGSETGTIYLRAEYTWMKDKIQHTIDHFRKMNLLGKDICGIEGFNFNIRLQLGAGAYVCGEETAMLNSLEGKRGEPRNKRFFPTERGYLQKPTVINNVETFCAAARIIQLGVDHYLQTGTPTSPGTKLLSVSGDCRLPGIYEIEWGTTVREILEKCEADRPHFIQVSGPSGECISMVEADRAIAMDDLVSEGSIMIFSRSRDILSILRNYNHFFKHESCGLCTPCRAGNFILEKKLDLFAAKLAHPSDVEEVRSWGEIMKLTCRCGLGKTAPNALLMAQEKFPEYFASIVDQNPERLSKGFSLKDAVREYDRFSS
ncbi:MAG: NAD(P)H-dependent oxidoreductase subunit E [Xanthomonadales bacterium]|nr:NAD(P)H-dependent oxidoreductase subunit E [Xanthomonadales bacterium]